MDIISLLFNEVLYRPLFNGLIFLYNTIPGHDFGVAIIALTLIIRAAIYPLAQKSLKSQRALTELQPKVKEIQQKYKDDKEKQGRALMELYKANKVNPASGCLPLLIQLPILLALFSVFRTGLDPERLNGLYSFISNPGVINHMFLGFLDLSQKNLYLALLAGAAQFIQSKMMMPKSNKSSATDFSGAMQKQMLYIFPIITVWIAASLPAGLGLYWLAMTLFGVAQQYFLLRKKNEQRI
ncbi:MAG: membrane protein insertase YidC [Candidatus Portnoybacteria bacterium]|nr:membrane protein insertase YidC [Candidatus Portnoybacteria bacterium]